MAYARISPWISPFPFLYFLIILEQWICNLENERKLKEKRNLLLRDGCDSNWLAITPPLLCIQSLNKEKSNLGPNFHKKRERELLNGPNYWTFLCSWALARSARMTDCQQICAVILLNAQHTISLSFSFNSRNWAIIISLRPVSWE